MSHRKCSYFVWSSVLLYGTESMTLKVAVINKLEELEMWIFRSILKLSWIALIIDERSRIVSDD